MAALSWAFQLPHDLSAALQQKLEATRWRGKAETQREQCQAFVRLFDCIRGQQDVKMQVDYSLISIPTWLRVEIHAREVLHDFIVKNEDNLRLEDPTIELNWRSKYRGDDSYDFVITLSIHAQVDFQEHRGLKAVDGVLFSQHLRIYPSQNIALPCVSMPYLCLAGHSQELKQGATALECVVEPPPSPDGQLAVRHAPVDADSSIVRWSFSTQLPPDSYISADHSSVVRTVSQD